MSWHLKLILGRIYANVERHQERRNILKLFCSSSFERKSLMKMVEKKGRSYENREIDKKIKLMKTKGKKKRERDDDGEEKKRKRLMN